MNISQAYILISIIVLAVIMVILLVSRKKMQKSLSRLSAFAFAFIIAGIVFGDNRLVGYSLMAIGIILAIVDIFRKSRSEHLK